MPIEIYFFNKFLILKDKSFGIRLALGEAEPLRRCSMKRIFSSLLAALSFSAALISPNAFAGESAKTQQAPWYLRIQQAPLIGLAAVSDSGVLDLELMKAVNRNFWIGPTVVAHADKASDTKMSSLNLGVRADFILPAFGNIDEGVYISTALLLGTYRSQTFSERTRWNEAGNAMVDEVTCDFKSEGFHRAGAFVVGKQFHLSNDLHLTGGLGVVKTKVMSSNQSGFCQDKEVVKSDGRSLPWFDLGVGFKL